MLLAAAALACAADLAVGFTSLHAPKGSARHAATRPPMLRSTLATPVNSPPHSPVSAPLKASARALFNPFDPWKLEVRTLDRPNEDLRSDPFLDAPGILPYFSRQGLVLLAQDAAMLAVTAVVFAKLFSWLHARAVRRAEELKRQYKENLRRLSEKYDLTGGKG